MPRKQPILLSQRRALRAWALQQHPRPSQKACIAWFQEQYNRTISQSTVSESLSSHFKAIDTSTNAARSRLRSGQWPDLENLLFLWQQEMEERGDTASGELLRIKAQQLWQQLPQYSLLPCPEFSKGWLQKFKQRHNIRPSAVDRELGSVSETAEGEMNGTRTLAGECNKKNVHNTDETTPCWIIPRFCSWVLDGDVRKNLTFPRDP
ncbi:CenpB-DNA-bind-domain-containing protein [Stipitochalara longipes BDJ]|nr:CenpB-DNA-bind-domain-containing protein [Stipitochalara longipes BDJ]